MPTETVGALKLNPEPLASAVFVLPFNVIVPSTSSLPKPSSPELAIPSGPKAPEPSA